MTKSNKQIQAALIALLVIAGVLSTPAGASDRNRPGVVLKAQSHGDAKAAADAIGGVLGEEILPGRSVYLIGLDSDDKNSNKESRIVRLASQASSQPGIFWAVPYGGEKGEAWSFYAWSFYAWPSGEISKDPDGLDLGIFLDLKRTHKIATGVGVKIAVLDTGFEVSHPDLRSVMVAGIDLVDADENVSDVVNGRDDDADGLIDEAFGHGTFVAGLLAQVAPSAEIVPIRVLNADGVGDLYAIIEGIDYAISRDVDIVNMSFGISNAHPELTRAIERAKAAGIVVVASAGNEGSVSRQYPAASSGVIGVAAYDPAIGSLADFATKGNWVDVSAPGVNIVSSVPGGGSGTWSGSSLAAPIVAAEVALLIELDPVQVPLEAELLVRESAAAAKGIDVGLIDLDDAIASLSNDLVATS